MTRSVRWSVAFSLLALLNGCASERAPINRVQPEALQKSFFVGASLTDDEDDPQFYYRPTVADVDYGASQSGLFTASYAQTTARIKWEITEDKLIARLAYERIEGATGNGIDETKTGQIAAAFAIEKHFDVRRDYNPQTGEELNVVVENDTDRPWYERDFMRVDWSQNLITTAYDLDTLAALKIFADEPLVYEPVAYSVKDPSDPDAPVFDAKTGYFDITNKVYVQPQILETPFGSFPACFFSPDVLTGGAPIADCNPVEVKIRLSFRQVEDRDYQPVDWDGTRMDMFGMFTTAERRGYQRNYGIVDEDWHRFASRHNIWQASHARDKATGALVACNTEATTPPGADADRDTPNPKVTGTADECDSVGGGSRCDKFVHACTMPYSQRVVRTTPFYYGLDSDPTLWESVRDAVGQWDVALRHAVLTARYTECLRVSQTGPSQSNEEIQACRALYPTSEAKADVIKNEPLNVFVFCHNPVVEADADECGEVGLTARTGDLRYNITNVIQNPQVPSPWGILADAIDPLTGEVVAASVNIWNAVTDVRTQLAVDQMRWYLGEISNEDVSSGRYLNDYLTAGTRAPSAAPRLISSPLLDDAQVGRRIAGVDRSLQTEPSLKTLPNLRQKDLIDWASDQARIKFGETALGSGNAGARARLLQTRDTPIETQLTTSPYLRLGGLNPATPPSSAALDLASPLRGNAVAFKAELDRLRENQMAQDGHCMVGAPEPISVDDWAQIMAQKFPLPANPTSTDVMNRNQKWHDYLRRQLTFGVILHELGHSMGLRHVFTSSFDAVNFHPQYWQLRTQDGSETKYCEEPTADGSTCIGPRWRDPVTEPERKGLLWMWEHTSVMDYPGDLTQEAVGIGAYDRAAIRFGYGDVTDVVDDPSVSCPPGKNGTRACTSNGLIISDLIDTSFGGIGGPWYRDNSGFFHYSQLAQKLNLVRECREADTSPPAGWDADRDGQYSPVFDGHIVNGTQCSGLPNDYVSYSELQFDAPGFQQAFGAFGGDPRKFDSRGRVRRPYMFGSDEYADIGNLAVLRDDNGADAYEVANFMINSFEDAHLWDNYRRNRSFFSLKTAFMRGYTRYNAKLKEISKGFGLYSELFSATNLLDATTQDDGMLKSNAIATSMVFDHFARMLTRPTTGVHFLDGGFDPRNVAAPGEFQVFRSTDQQLFVNDAPQTGGILMSVPDGSQGIGTDLLFGGRPLFNQLDRTKGYYATQYDAWVGSYYDKTIVADMLTDCEDRFISTSRDDFVDGRYRNISLATVFPDGVRRLIAAALTEDATSLGWRVETEGGEAVVQDDMSPSTGMGYRSFWPKDGPEVCWRRSGALICKEYTTETPIDDSAPAQSLPIDPEVGFEVQKFLVYSALVNLPESYKEDWIDMMRIFRIGTNSPPFSDNQASWTDPLSGLSYVAHRYGYEKLDGRDVDRGIGARVLDWMNTLTQEAYEITSVDPVTGEVTYAKTANGQPVVKSPRFANRVKNYQGLLDFMQEVSGAFGFYGPSLRGVY